jgi:protein-S-isoprenylcysteine O-methyltransferase Ste14
MSSISPSTRTPSRFHLTPGVVNRLAQLVFLVLLQAALLFGCAGRLDWGAAWLYLAVYVASLVANALLLLPQGSALIEERGRLAFPHRWDQIILVFYTLGSLGLLVVSGLDERFGWTVPLGLPVQGVGLVGVIFSLALFDWSLVTNAYFATAARVQAERAQQVVTTGPYRFVRHPGYSGALHTALSLPLLLGSLWAYLPGFVLVAAIVARTVFEDRMLRAELAGYADYARRVRYRLLPGVW